MNAHMATKISENFQEPEEQQPVRRKKDKNDVFIIGEDEIGLLDIVLMDAITTNDSAVNG